MMLEEKYKLALDQAVEWINKNFTPISIVVGGSIIRNNYDNQSDLDIYVIHNENYRQRLLKYFNNIPCDIFINNKKHIENYFIEEHNKNRPTTANLLATGNVIFGQEEIFDILLQAKKFVNFPKKLNSDQIQKTHYYILSLIEDAEDILEKDLACCSYIINKVTFEIIDYYYLINLRVLPRIKERISLIEDLEIKNILINILSNKNNNEKVELIKLLLSLLSINQDNKEWVCEKE